jgi:isopentenyl diphosphate isomerase/L-lactate dehydrogenase-like FMN-dependent dehydrogenase
MQQHRGFPLDGTAGLPGPIFHYIDGAADDEVTYRRNTEAYERCDLVPNVLAGVTGFSHVSIVVPDIEAAARKLQERYGLQVGQRMVNAAQDVRLAYIDVGATKIELMEPSRPDPPVAKFLDVTPKGASTIFPSEWTASMRRPARSAKAGCESLGMASHRPASGAIVSPSSIPRIFWVSSLNSKSTKLQQITREEQTALSR